MVNEIGVKVERQCKLFDDNDGARQLAMHGMGQKKARHLSSKYHKVQELCEEGKVIILRVPTEDQPADLLTINRIIRNDHIFHTHTFGAFK